MVKVLIIGGSTLNDGDGEELASILIDSNNSFLKEWAIVIAIHNFLLLEDQVRPGLRITREPISDLNRVTVNAQENNDEHLTWFNNNSNQNLHQIMNEDKYFIENNNIYILGGGINQKRILCFKVKEENNSLFIEAKFFSSDTDDDTCECEGRQNNGFILSYPSINCIMEEFLANSDKLEDLAGVVLAGFDNDGAEGLLAMKRNGCKTAVQNPEECDNGRNSEMPQNALDAAREQSSGHDIITLGTAEFPTFVEWFSNLNNNT
jgi:hypothetical protein